MRVFDRQGDSGKVRELVLIVKGVLQSIREDPSLSSQRLKLLEDGVMARFSHLEGRPKLLQRLTIGDTLIPAGLAKLSMERIIIRRGRP